jgi:ribosomal protein S4E
MKIEPGASCLVVKGTHTGEIAKLEKLIERPGSHDTEALLSAPGGQFVTVAKYLFIVDKDYA